MRSGSVVAVSRDEAHRFSKPVRGRIRLLAGLGVEGDAHLGTTVQHGSRVAQDPTQPNLRQVHLIHAELFEELGLAGYEVSPGDLGENITTRDVDLHALPVGSLLRIGRDAVVEVTGLRNPCLQIDAFRAGLLRQVIGRGADGSIVRRAGVMGVVVAGGTVEPGDAVAVELPTGPHHPLERV